MPDYQPSPDSAEEIARAVLAKALADGLVAPAARWADPDPRARSPEELASVSRLLYGYLQEVRNIASRTGCRLSPEELEARFYGSTRGPDDPEDDLVPEGEDEEDRWDGPGPPTPDAVVPGQDPAPEERFATDSAPAGPPDHAETQTGLGRHWSDLPESLLRYDVPDVLPGQDAEGE